MKIYTSYFGNWNSLKKADIVPVSIALFSPKWYEGYRFHFLAPTRYMVLGDCEREEYVSLYRQILDKYGAEKIVQAVNKVSYGKDVALLCYEKPGEFCHRHLLADYLNEKLNLGVTEFGADIEKEEDNQLSLF